MVTDDVNGLARDAIRVAENLLAGLADALTNEIAIIDATGRILAVNSAWEAFAKRNGDPDLRHTGPGQNYLEVCRRSATAGSDDAVEAMKGLQAVLDGSSPEFAFEYLCESPGLRGWYLLTASPLLSEPMGAIVCHRDITATRRANEALRLGGELRSLASVSDTLLPALVKNLAATLGVRHAFLCELADERTQSVRLLAHWAGNDYGELFEYSAEGTPCAHALAGEFCYFPTRIQELFPTDSWLGDIGADSYMAVPILDSAGKPMGHLGVIDSNPIRADLLSEFALRLYASYAAPELELRRSEAFGIRQARLIDNLHDAVVGTDEDFIITSWNRAAEETYGWRADEVLGLPARDVLQTEFTGLQRDEAIRLAREAEFRGEIVQRRKDGSRVNIETTSMSFKASDGTIRGYVSVNRDITQRKQADDALRQALTAKDQFLSLVSHELRTPITVILGNAWLLKSRGPGQSAQDRANVVDAIYDESLRLKGIIENLLMLARQDRGQEMEVEPVLLARVVDKIVHQFARTARHEIALNLLDEGLAVLGNAVAIEQVIRNLLSNAEKYSPAGSTITLSMQKSDSNVIFSVSDRGPGISPQAMPQLFQPFYRAEPTRKPGMGIGLTVCQRLIEAMNGRIWAANDEGGGAVFSFSLPALEASFSD